MLSRRNIAWAKSLPLKPILFFWILRMGVSFRLLDTSTDYRKRQGRKAGI